MASNTGKQIKSSNNHYQLKNRKSTSNEIDDELSDFFNRHASGQAGIIGYILMEKTHSIGQKRGIDEIITEEK